MGMLEKGSITRTQYRQLYQPWGKVTEWVGKNYKGKAGVWKGRDLSKAPSSRAQIREGDERLCRCIPQAQPAFYEGQATSPPDVCGQMKKGKKVTIDPMTGKTFVKNGKIKQGFYYKDDIKYGTAVDKCRVSCRSCQQAENRYLQRLRYSKAEFQELLKLGNVKKENVAKKWAKSLNIKGGTDPGLGKWKLVKRKVLEWVKHVITKKVVKKIQQSYPIKKVCTDNKGTNFLKCGEIKKNGKDPRDICKKPYNPAVVNPATRCKVGFTPM